MRPLGAGWRGGHRDYRDVPCSVLCHFNPLSAMARRPAKREPKKCLYCHAFARRRRSSFVFPKPHVAHKPLPTQLPPARSHTIFGPVNSQARPLSATGPHVLHRLPPPWASRQPGKVCGGCNGSRELTHATYDTQAEVVGDLVSGFPGKLPRERSA